MASSDPDVPPKLFAGGNRRPSAPAPVLDKIGVPAAPPPARFRSGTVERNQSILTSVSPSPASASRTGSDSGAPGVNRAASNSKSSSPLSNRGRERAPSSPIRAGVEPTADIISTSLPPVSALAAHGKQMPKSPLARKTSAEPPSFPVGRPKFTPPYTSPLSSTSEHPTAAPSPPLPDLPPPAAPPPPPPLHDIVRLAEPVSLPPPPLLDAALPPPEFSRLPIPPVAARAPNRISMPPPTVAPPQVPGTAPSLGTYHSSSAATAPPPAAEPGDPPSSGTPSTPSSLYGSYSSLNTHSPAPSPIPSPRPSGASSQSSSIPPTRPPMTTPKITSKSSSSRSLSKAGGDSDASTDTPSAGTSLNTSTATLAGEVLGLFEAQSSDSMGSHYSHTAAAAEASNESAPTEALQLDDYIDASSLSLFDTVDRRQFAQMVEMAAVARAEGPDLLTSRRTLRLSKHIGTLRRQRQPIPLPWLPEAFLQQASDQHGSPSVSASLASLSAFSSSSHREEDLLEVQSLIEVQERGAATGNSPARVSPQGSTLGTAIPLQQLPGSASSSSAAPTADWETLDSDINDIAAAAVVPGETPFGADDSDEEAEQTQEGDDDDDSEEPEEHRVLDWFISDHRGDEEARGTSVEDISEQLLGLEYESIKNKLFLAPDEEWDNAVRDMEAEVLGALQLEGNETNLKGLNLMSAASSATAFATTNTSAVSSSSATSNAPISGTATAVLSAVAHTAPVISAVRSSSPVRPGLQVTLPAGKSSLVHASKSTPVTPQQPPSGFPNFTASSSAPAGEPSVLLSVASSPSPMNVSPLQLSPLSTAVLQAMCVSAPLPQQRVPTPALGITVSRSNDSRSLRSATAAPSYHGGNSPSSTANAPPGSASAALSSTEINRSASPPLSPASSPSSSGTNSPAEPRRKEKDSLVRFLHRRKPDGKELPPSAVLRTTAGHLLLYHDPAAPLPSSLPKSTGTSGPSKSEKKEKKEKDTLWRKRWVSADTSLNVYKRVGDPEPLFSVPLSSVVSVSVPEKDKSMTFSIVCAECTLRFQAHNRDDLTEWLAHLEARGAFLIKCTYLQIAKKVRVDQPRISATELKTLVIAKFVEGGITSLADARAAEHYGLFVPQSQEWLDESRVIRTEVIKNFELELKMKPRE